tara:strand:+ start:524 stop:748 length:225 start_codon:yes stop_codon:yes gene_type:complete
MKYLFTFAFILGACASQVKTIEIADLWETNEMFDHLEYHEMGCDCDEDAEGFVPAALEHELCPTHHRVMVDESR